MKWLFVFLLAVLVFGGAAFFSYDLFVKPETGNRAEKSGEIPVEPVPDISLPGISSRGQAPAGRTS